ncbi:MAG: hypothetical protein EPO21_22405 [Chloroflexota bacterium]|nr:MAG: hypothetical protein EPO21_22405 [Chloroflexota bacterium]
MKVVFDKTPVVTDHHFQFCPGCTHGITIRLIGEVLEQMGLANRAVGLVGDGCMSWSLQY